jgi:uncharacterized coiled-coil DUF342 family protein
MRNYVCEQHGEDVVVYQAQYPRTECPLCAACKKIDELESEAEKLEDKLENFSAEIVDLRFEARATQETISKLELAINLQGSE